MDIMFVKDSNPNEDLEGVHGIRPRNCDTNKAVIVNTIDTDIHTVYGEVMGRP